MSSSKAVRVKFVTSTVFPETTALRSHWGVTDNGHLPFQLKAIEKIQGEEKVNFAMFGDSHDHICDESTKAKDEERCLASLFYPNAIETQDLHTRRLPLLKDHRNPNSGYVEKLALISYVFIDIDFHGNEQFRIETLDKITDLNFAKPDCIVDTGNGLHLYWAVETVSLVDLVHQKTRQHAADQLKIYYELQRHLAAYFKADPQVVSSEGRCMRIPGTWNLKDPNNPKLCRYIQLPGWRTVEDAREKPRWTLKTLRTVLKQYGVFKTKKGRIKRPKPDKRRWLQAQVKFVEHMKHLGIKPTKALLNYLQYFYGLRRLWCGVLEGAWVLKQHLKCNGDERKKARAKLVELGFAEIIEEHNFIKGKATVWRLTSK